MMMMIRDIILVIYNTYIYLNITNPMNDDDDDDKGHYTSHI